MTTTLRQRVTIRGASAAELFDDFLDAKRHAGITGGSPARINAKEGSTFEVGDGYATGKNLRIVPKTLIAQSWRTTDFADGDPDSILVLAFSDTPQGGRIDMTHANVPSDQADDYAEGWKEYYWKPWKAYVRERSSRKR